MNNFKFHFPKIERFTLKNGLMVFWIPRKEINHIHMDAVLKTGSREEPSEFAGISHFLEHLILFSPTKSFPTLDKISNFSSQVGGWVNASTYFSKIILTGDFSIKNFSQASTLFKERLFCLEFNSEIFKNERERIIQEIKGEKDDSMTEISNLLIENQVKGNDLTSCRLLGDEKSVKKIGLSDVKDYYKRIANPLNTILIISGPASLGKSLKVELFKNWGNIENKYKKFPQIKKTSFVNFSEKHYQRKDLQEVYFAFSFPVHELLIKKEYELLKLLMYILDFNEKSVIESIERKGLAYYLSKEYILFSDKGLLNFYGHTENVSKLKKILSYLEDNLINSNSKTLTPSLFKRAKEKYLLFYLMDLENEEDISFYIQDRILISKKSVDFKKEFKEIKEISFSDIKKFMDKLFVKNNMNIVTMSKDKKINFR